MTVSNPLSDVSFVPLSRILFTVPNITDRVLYIDEDYGRATSRVLRDCSQYNRQPIEGNCELCSKVLEPESHHGCLTFCRKYCGENFHTACIKLWFQEKPLEGCPGCGELWKVDSDVIVLEHELEEQAVDAYIAWAERRRTLQELVPDPAKSRPIDCLAPLLYLNSVGQVLQSDALVAETTMLAARGWVEFNWYLRFGSPALHNLYSDLKLHEVSRRSLFVRGYQLSLIPEDFQRRNAWPKEFILDLAKLCIEYNTHARLTLKDVFAKDLPVAFTKEASVELETMPLSAMTGAYDTTSATASHASSDSFTCPEDLSSPRAWIPNESGVLGSEFDQEMKAIGADFDRITLD